MKKKYFIYLFTDRGFGSEILTLGISIILSDSVNLKFKMCSIYSNITYRLGWGDYFEPFCEEITDPILRKTFEFWGHDFKSQYKKFVYKINVYWFLGFDFVCMHDLWERIWSKDFNKGVYNSFNLKLNNTTSVESMSIVLNSIWRPKNFILKEVEEFVSNHKLFPGTFISLHVRRGDKIHGSLKEADIVDINLFINYITLNLNTFRKILLITDDYSCYEELKAKIPSSEIICSADKAERGYYNSAFNNMPSDYRFNKIKNLITQIELCRLSDFFLGTYSTNLSRLIAVLRNDINCHDILNADLKIVL